MEKQEDKTLGRVMGIIFLLILSAVVTLNIVDDYFQVRDPKVGNYYIFNNYPGKGEEFIMKIKNVEKDSIEFYFPLKTLAFGFDIDDQELIREADQEGTLYDDTTIKISKAKIKELLDNDSIFDFKDKNAKIEDIF